MELAGVGCSTLKSWGFRWREYTPFLPCIGGLAVEAEGVTPLRLLIGWGPMAKDTEPGSHLLELPSRAAGWGLWARWNRGSPDPE